MHQWRRVVVAGAFFLGLRLLAQDVTVTPLEWMDHNDPPDQLPQVTRPAKIEFPDELRKTPDIGYALREFHLDEKGKFVAGRVRATQPAYDAAINEGMGIMRFSPGKRSGNAVNTWVRCAVIFNPATAATAGPEATPRLLAVTPVLVAREAKSGAAAMPEGIAEADVVVDSSGRVSAVRSAPAGWEQRFLKTAQDWRFAPARSAGRPVEATVRMPFVIAGIDPDDALGALELPRARVREEPEYPPGMAGSGLRGDVVVELTVDIEGRVLNAYVVSSLNPAFDEPALTAIRKWRFEPGRRGGVPVSTRMQQRLTFNIPGMAGGGRDGIEITAAKDASVPQDFTPAKFVGVVVPVYPHALLRDKVKGQAKVEFIIDTEGRVAKATVTEASRPEFGRALQAAAELFTFQPAIKDGRPVVSQMAFEQKFAPSPRDATLSVEELDMVRQELKKPESIVGADKLDTRLRPVAQRPPAFPLSLPSDITQGEAMLDIIIDTEGRVRLPRVVSASDEVFGYAAVQSVVSWRFEPPLIKGKPVVVKVRVPFVFRASPPPGAEQPR